MAKYRLKKEHYLQAKKPGAKPDDPNPWAKEPQLHEKDSVVEWDGAPSLQMEPIDKEAKERVSARLADFSEKKKQAMASRGSVGWSRQFEANLVRVITGDSPKDDAPPQAKTGVVRNKRAA